MEIDGIDRKILHLLRENSRIHNVEIAASVGLTEGAVRNRIDKLVKNGIIRKFSIETVSGAEVFGIVMLKAKSETKKMMKEVALLSIAKDAFEISGEYDGCILLESPSLEELDAKIDKLRSCKTVADTRTFVAVKKW